MARNAKSDDGSKSKKWQFQGFINHEFTPAQIQQMTDYFDQRTFDHADTLQHWTDEGFKVSISYDEYRNCYLMSFTGKKTGTKIDGWIIQVRHSDVEKLLQASAFMLHELYPAGVFEGATKTQEEFGW